LNRLSLDTPVPFSAPTEKDAEGHIRVLVVDHHQIVAEGLANLLELYGDLTVVGTAGTVADGVQLALDFEPDVIVAADNLPDGSLGHLAAAIRPFLPEIPTVVLATDLGDDALLRAVQDGARAFLPKTVAVSQVIESIRRAAAGEMLIAPDVLVRLLGRQRARNLAEATRLLDVEALTSREQEVLDLMAQGLDNRAISERLYVSYSTVRSHVQSVLGKLGAHTRLEAVARATRLGLADSFALSATPDQAIGALERD
jgi:two-component system, NarL family, nitrate/nitrite response regulator NarL